MQKSNIFAVNMLKNNKKTAQTLYAAAEGDSFNGGITEYNGN